MAVQATSAVLLLIGLLGSTVRAQFRVFSGAEKGELERLSDPEKLQVAARTGETHLIRLTNDSQSAVAQEGVNLNIDCLPFLEQFPGGSIQWTFIQLDEFGNVQGNELHIIRLTLCSRLIGVPVW